MDFVTLHDLSKKKQCQVLLLTVICEQGVVRLVVFEVCWTGLNKRSLNRSHARKRQEVQQPTATENGFPVSVCTRILYVC